MHQMQPLFVSLTAFETIFFRFNKHRNIQKKQVERSRLHRSALFYQYFRLLFIHSCLLFLSRPT